MFEINISHELWWHLRLILVHCLPLLDSWLTLNFRVASFNLSPSILTLTLLLPLHDK